MNEYMIPLWLAIPLLIVCFGIIIFLLQFLEPRLRGFTHRNPKPKSRPPLGQAPMSPLVRRNLKEVAKAVRNRKKTLILEGKLYTLKEITRTEKTNEGTQ